MNALIFDLDGTLLDTEPLYTVAAEQVLAEHGHGPFDAGLKRRTMGGNARVSAQMVIDFYSLPLTVDDYLGQRETLLREMFPTAPEIGGAGTFVVAAREAGLRVGLATSSTADMVDLKLSRRTWRDAFEVVVCGDDAELERSKPEPDIFLLCARRLAVDPVTCVAFEDSPNGVRAARAAAMRVVGINSPFVEDGDLAEAHQLIDSYTDLAIADVFGAT